MIRRLAILCSLLTILIMVCTQTSQAEKLTLVGGDIIVNIDSANNSGSTQIHLRNDTEESIKISLHAKNFILQTTQKEISAQVVAYVNKNLAHLRCLNIFFPSLKEDSLISLIDAPTQI